MREEIISAGIDVGTSTTQLVFSLITVENLASMFSVPRVTIIDKKVIYRSNIYFTPLISQSEIDAEGVKNIVEKEYINAKISKSDVKTGAVIITGETSRKINAESVTNTLSGLAGDFVVAAAGPDLESIIAGKGAGADKISKDYKGVVVNLDIGGGTTNISVFRRGELLDVGCLDIGGRLIKLDSNGKIIYIADKIKSLMANLDVKIAVGDVADELKLRKIAARLVKLLEMAVGLIPRNNDYKHIVTNKGIKSEHPIDYITISGGVGDIVYTSQKDSIFEYEDIGVLLGQEIKKSSLVKELKLMIPNETMRATVIGAGSHTADISGSTIFYNDSFFPLKNIPILKLNEFEEKTELIARKIHEKIEWTRTDGIIQQAAIAIKGKKNYTFNEINILAKEIVKGMEEVINKNYILFVLIEEDIAKVLGQSIYTKLGFKNNVLCIDNITVENGDYIDVGYPIANGAVVPVVIKTLIFG
jgi:ethanolamine utilization protein EutA